MLAPKTCPGCGADDLGRGRSRTRWQSLVRDLTPLRRYRCRACAREGWTLRPLPRSRHPEELGRGQPAGRSAGRSAGRAAERRDEAARRTRLVRLAASIALAILLGAVAANRLVACQTPPPAPAGE